MAQQKKARLTESFVHPSAGVSTRVDRYLAVRWKNGVSADARAKLLRAAGVELAGLDEKAPPPLPQVNQTDGLSWVQGAKGGSVSAEAIATLEASELVEWVSPGYRAAQETSSIFTVNPTRLYVKEAALLRAGGLSALGVAASVDAARTTRLRGYVALAVENPSVAEGRTAIEAASAAIATAARRHGRARSGRHQVRDHPVPVAGLRRLRLRLRAALDEGGSRGRVPPAVHRVHAQRSDVRHCSGACSAPTCRGRGRSPAARRRSPWP